MEQEKVLINATVVFLVRSEEVLLAMKTEKIGKGCWNGYGGGVEEGETSEEATVRELYEEATVVVKSEDLEKVAIIDFHNTKSDGCKFVCKVHFYISRKWIGEPKESRTMITPTWFDIDNLPFEKMMPSEKYWLKRILTGEKLRVSVKLGPFQKELLGDVQITSLEATL